MPSMEDLIRACTDLGSAEVDWLHRLVSQWQLLADLSFADLSLWVRMRPELAADYFIAVAQMRPTTGPTCYLDDRVGRRVTGQGATRLRIACEEGRICREGEPIWRSDLPVREETIPVRYEGKVIAVVARDTNLAAPRAPSRLEIAYLNCSSDLANMLAEGSFPVLGWEHGDSPRVGDGLIRLGSNSRVEFASPNAQSAYRRLGFSGDLAGAHLASLTLQLAPSAGLAIRAAGGRAAAAAEVEAGATVVQLRAIPLTPGGKRIGALVLVRDVSEERRRDRQLVSKDATIREIHHRVKNNLQTVAALLRLQARRLESPEARAALDESVRRVSSIALVHETLSLTLDEHVAFDDIADRVVGMVADVSLVSGNVVLRREGSFGVLPAPLATALALVLTELLQNAAEHGFHGGDRDDRGESLGEVVVAAERSEGRLVVRVCDSGAGLPPGFNVDAADGLGLQIVRALVVGEIGGRLELRSPPGGGTQAVVEVPLVG